MHIIGTAGHVDHGKSALVQALTGTDPDRWIEEKLRGMTLDLGFAHLRFADGVEAGIIDVPGHERFVHNMLAGAAGMELLLLVVAANEGVMPQTLEHLAILDHLDVRRALVVLTKRDLVDDAELRAVEAEIGGALAATIVGGAPVVAVSAHTGEGIDLLRDTIRDALVALPERAIDAPVFLPVDRVFAIPGHGTVVTGTLVQGTIRTGDTLQIDEPPREVRVRSLQVFGEPRAAVSAGARVAVNVAGIEVAELRRGAVLAERAVTVANAMRVRVRSAAGTPLRRRTPVRAHLGAAEILGTLVCDAAPAAAATTDATLFLRRAAATYPGEAFVVRALSPKVLLGGGTIGDTATAQLGDTTRSERDTIAAVLSASGLAPLGVPEIAARANVREEHAGDVLAELIARGLVRRLQKPVAYLGGAAADDLTARIAAILARREAETPWVLGVTSLALARELAVDEGLLMRVLAADADDGRIVARAGYYATLAHRPQLTGEQYAFFDRAAVADASAMLIPVELETLVAEIKRTKIAGLGQAFDTLLATEALVKVGPDVYRGTQIAEIRRRLEASIRRDGPITMARFRDAVGTTRKYAVPLMEWFDATGVTVRDGDVRSLRSVTRR